MMVPVCPRCAARVAPLATGWTNVVPCWRIAVSATSGGVPASITARLNASGSSTNNREFERIRSSGPARKVSPVRAHPGGLPLPAERHQPH